jgi:hypothetical protein
MFVLCSLQIQYLGYPRTQLNEAQIDRCLEAYLLWLLGKTMFTEPHGDSISARFITIAFEIANARRPEDIRQRSFGSAVLAATYRGMCTACQRNSANTMFLGCPLFVQLWSWERFPVGRPDVDIARPWDAEESHIAGVEMPTVGTVWARREVSFYFSHFY